MLFMLDVYLGSVSSKEPNDKFLSKLDEVIWLAGYESKSSNKTSKKRPARLDERPPWEYTSSIKDDSLS